MENSDFEMPSPKRQKTDSPPQTHVIPPKTSITSTADIKHGAEKEQDTGATALETATSAAATENFKTEEKDMLDVLMQHVESEAASRDQPIGLMEQEHQQLIDPVENTVEHPQSETKDTDMVDTESTVAISQPAEPELTQQQQHAKETAPTEVSQETQTATSDIDTFLKPHDLPAGLEPTKPDAIEHLRAVAETNHLPPTSDTLASEQIPPATEAAQQTDGPAGESAEPREWETDSSPYDSSSSDDTSDSDSSDDDEDDEEEYTLLNPYEQAAILMADAGGDDDISDDEGRRSSNRPNAGLRTVNEKPEEILPKPNITITESMHIEELGSVQAIVENTLLVTANTGGEYQVLESNSLLCTAARLPIGVVAETLGRVEAPLYTVRFASDADIKESGVNEKGTKIYYVPSHSTFVFTQPLKAVKGSDASNFHDEEVGDDEMEFSDDEAEAEHKRQMKLKKKGIDPNSVPPPSRGGRGGRGQRSRGGRGGTSNMHAIPESDTASAYGTTSIEMNYDEIEEGETEYTPLRRPEVMAQTNPHGTYTNGSMSPPQPHSNFSARNSQDSRGSRGGRGRGNSNHNSRGRGRGGGGYTQNQNQNQTNRSPYNKNTNSYSSQNNYSPSSNTSMYATSPPQQQSQPQFHALPPPPPPPAPYLTPSSGPYDTNNTTSGNATPTGGMYTVPPSPMTPLPGGQFNFSFNPGQYQAQQQQTQVQAQGQWTQYHANMNQYQQQYGGYGNASTNAEAIAQVQRTLEELRRAAGNGGYNANGWNGGQQ